MYNLYCLYDIYLLSSVHAIYGEDMQEELYGAIGCDRRVSAQGAWWNSCSGRVQEVVDFGTVR